jgi:hypothetical protein
MDQADEVEIIRHSCKLAAYSLQGEKETTVEHEPENAAEHLGLTMIFSERS